MTERFHERLDRLIKEADLSDKEFGLKAERDRSSIYLFRKGELKPGVDTARSLATLLKDEALFDLWIDENADAPIREKIATLRARATAAVKGATLSADLSAAIARFTDAHEQEILAELLARLRDYGDLEEVMQFVDESINTATRVRDRVRKRRPRPTTGESIMGPPPQNPGRST